MKIGIFGDSYGFHHSWFPGESWVSLLKKDFDVTSFCKNGASPYFIYKTFLENYKSFDKIVYIITNSCRIHTTFNPIPTYRMAEYYLTTEKLSRSTRAILEGVSKYLEFSIADYAVEDQFITFHKLMLAEVKRLSTSVLFIKAFSDNRFPELAGPALWDITNFENAQWGEDWKKFQKFQYKFFETRQCHLTWKNNEILYRKVKDEIINLSGNSDFCFDINDFTNPDCILNYLPDEIKDQF